MLTTWNEVSKHFEHVTDKLGKGIDVGIFDTVVALNMLGIGTRQSCEGHIDWGVPYPWVNIEHDAALKHRLYGYLSQFYQERPMNFDCALGFQGYRLMSQGGAFADHLTEAERQQRLRAYQAEMGAFTSFLKTLVKA